MVTSPFTRKFLIVLAFVVCIFYLAYRAIYTFNSSGTYALTVSILLYVAECWGIFNLFLFFMQVWEVNEPPAQPVLEGRSVEVFVPTYNEDVSLLRATLEACVRMDYPHKTYVLDDGRRPEVEALARELNINYIARPDNRHFKAGNLNYAFERTDGEFVVILDADHVPEPHFITRLIGYFSDDKLGYVQTPHAFYNFDSFQARLDHKNRKYWEEGHLFYYVIQPGRNHWGCPIFAGSAAMFRRRALQDVGLIATETITEDLHTGLRMNAKGWRSLAITDRLIAGQAAPDITTFHSQRLRWGTGNLSILKYDNPLFAKGLSLPQRLCYLGSMLHWASGIFKLIIYLTPVAMLFSGIPPVNEFTYELLGVTLMYLIVSLTTLKMVSNGYGSIINSELFSMVNFWNQIKSTFRAVLGYGSRMFNVTPKGAAAVKARQQKSVWPYIRPQTYLIILSVLALFWGWGKLLFDGNLLLSKYPALNDVPVVNWILKHTPAFGFGISDDYFKPVVPTIWVLIHFWLAYKVTQRAFWPADRRFTTRHVVHVPVEYESPKGPAGGRYGVTVDLNDTGMAFVAYERFATGDVLRFTVRGAGEVIRCKGEIRTVTDLTQGQVAEGFRYGVQFVSLTSPQIDALNRICLHYGVPRMYGEFDKKRGGFLGGIKRWQDRGMSQRRGETRNLYQLPIVVNHGTTEDTAQFSATEDLSRTAVAAMLDQQLPQNSPVGFLMASPLGDVRGTARVVRSLPEQYGGRDYYRTVLEFREFDGQGRTTLNSLLNPEESRPLKDALKPDRKPILVQMAGATLVAVLIAIPLLVLQGTIFQYWHKDDRILRDIAARGEARQELSQADTDAVNRIMEKTLSEKYPSNDRLVLLMNALKVFGRKQDQLRIAEELAGRNAQDLGLQRTLIYAKLSAGDVIEAERTYSDIQKKINSGARITGEQFVQYRLSGARIADARGDMKTAVERYKVLYETIPNYVAEDEQKKADAVPLFREYAGVLLKAGHTDPKYYDEVKEVLKETTPADMESRKLLVAAHLLKASSLVNDPDLKRREMAKEEYVAAEQIAESMTVFGRTQNKPEIVATADQMKIDVQMAQTSWANARRLMDKLVEGAGGDKSRMSPELLRRLSVIQEKEKLYADALDGFSILIETNKVSGPELVETAKGFIDSAVSGTVKLGDREAKIALGLVNDAPTLFKGDKDYTGYLARLSTVLQRTGKPVEARSMLDTALKTEPQNPVLLQQMASLYIQAGMTEDAARTLSRTNAWDGKLFLAGVLIDKGSLTEAVKTITSMIANYPVGTKGADGKEVTIDDHRKVELLQGWVLEQMVAKSAGKVDGTNYSDVLKHYEAMDRRYKNDRETSALIASTYLAAANDAREASDKAVSYAAALKRLTTMIATQQFSPDGKSRAARSSVEDMFINAASGAEKLDDAQVEIVKEIAQRRTSAATVDPVLATRLAWVLAKVDKKETRQQASDLLKKALASNPKDEDRREIANVFAAAKDFKSAADALGGIKKGGADAFMMAKLYAGARQWPQAKEQLQAVIADKTSDAKAVTEAKLLLAKVNGWQGGKEQFAESLRLLDELTKQDPENLETKLFQAEVNIWAQNYDRALSLYTDLYRKTPNNADVARGLVNAAAKTKTPLTQESLGTIDRIRDMAMAPDNKDALLAARLGEVFATNGDPIRGRQFALKAYQLDPKDPVVRKEVGYVLANEKVQLFKEADDLLATSELVGEERRYYAYIASQAENYDAARKQARLYLEEQLPGSPAHRAAQRLLADVLTWKGDYEEALRIYEKLLGTDQDKRELRVDIAQVHRFWQNYPTALAKYADLLNESFESTQLWIGFIDAASSVQPDSRLVAHRDLLLKVYNRYAAEIQDPRRMSRLAWVMHRLGESVKANELLSRAVAANPPQPAVRKELAGVLAAVSRRNEAIAMLTPPGVLDTLDPKELVTLSDLLTAESLFDRAEVELAKIVSEKSDLTLQLRYASVLLWNEKYTKAQEILARLQRENPKNRDIALRIAQAYLWSRKDYTTALARYTDVLVLGPAPGTTEVFADPEVWRGFVDAAAGAVGESLRELPRQSLGSFFTPFQRESIFKAYNMMPTIQAKVTLENKSEMDKFVTQASGTPNFEERRQQLVRVQDNRIKGVAGSMGRLGLLLGMLGDRGRSDGAFGAALAIDRTNRDVWLQYAQTLTAQGDDVKAKAVFDWLIANPANKLPAPSDPGR